MSNATGQKYGRGAVQATPSRRGAPGPPGGCSLDRLTWASRAPAQARNLSEGDAVGAFPVSTSGIASHSAGLTQFHALNVCYLVPSLPGVPSVSVPVVICQNTGLLGGIVDGLIG